MRTYTLEQFAKLPKWAQAEINNLTRQRDVAVKTLNEALDKQTPSAISYQETPCTGENAGPTFKTVYVQSNKLEIVHAGVRCFIFLAPENDSQRPFGIEINFEAEKRGGWNTVGVSPSNSRLYLLHKDNMR